MSRARANELPRPTDLPWSDGRPPCCAPAPKGRVRADTLWARAMAAPVPWKVQVPERPTV